MLLHFIREGQKIMENDIVGTIQYEPQADVLSIESSREKIDYAREVGNVVVHFTSTHNPVLIEILDASKFIARSENLIHNKAGAR